VRGLRPPTKVHKTIKMKNAKVYVGTYAKYNSGSLAGKWLTLTDYSDQDEFIEACKELHKDEDDPELMFQDTENLPDALYSESEIDSEFWEVVNELDDSEDEAWGLFATATGEKTVERLRECYMGKWNSEEEFVQEQMDQLGSIPEHLEYYIDWSKMARDWFMGDYWMEQGHVFRHD